MVLDSKNGLFIVPSSWIFDEDGDVFTQYPPKNAINKQKLVQDMKEPAKDWIVVKVEIL